MSSETTSETTKEVTNAEAPPEAVVTSTNGHVNGNGSARLEEDAKAHGHEALESAATSKASPVRRRSGKEKQEAATPAETAKQDIPTLTEQPEQPSPAKGTTAREPVPAPRDGLRLRMKVWTDPRTSKRYLVPSAFMRDIRNGQPVSDIMYAYAMSEDTTELIELRVSEWNALPFYYFEEVGTTPRASTRPLDAVP